MLRRLLHQENFMRVFYLQDKTAPRRKGFGGRAVKTHKKPPNRRAQKYVRGIRDADIPRGQNTRRVHENPGDDADQRRKNDPADAKQRLFIDGNKIPFENFQNQLTKTKAIAKKNRPGLEKT